MIVVRLVIVSAQLYSGFSCFHKWNKNRPFALPKPSTMHLGGLRLFTTCMANFKAIAQVTFVPTSHASAGMASRVGSRESESPAAVPVTCALEGPQLAGLVGGLAQLGAGEQPEPSQG